MRWSDVVGSIRQALAAGWVPFAVVGDGLFGWVWRLLLTTS